jgi:hypothetical protein
MERLPNIHPGEAKFWLGLQDDFNIENEMLERQGEFNQNQRL